MARTTPVDTTVKEALDALARLVGEANAVYGVGGELKPVLSIAINGSTVVVEYVDKAAGTAFEPTVQRRITAPAV